MLEVEHANAQLPVELNEIDRTASRMPFAAVISQTLAFSIEKPGRQRPCVMQGYLLVYVNVARVESCMSSGCMCSPATPRCASRPCAGLPSVFGASMPPLFTTKDTAALRRSVYWITVSRIKRYFQNYGYI